MTYLKISLLSILSYTFLLVCSCNTLETKSEVVLLQDSTLKSAKILRSSGFKAELLQINLIDYKITADSYGNIIIRSGSKILKKSLDLGQGFYTHAIHFYDDDDKIVLFFETMNSTGSYNKAFCINKTFGNIEWKASLGNFNLSVGQAENGIIYIGSSENAYALNLETGKLLWKTEGLYHQYGFNYYDSIIVAPNSVKLIGATQTVLGRVKEVKTVSIDKRTGKIQTVKLAESPNPQTP